MHSSVPAVYVSADALRIAAARVLMDSGTSLNNARAVSEMLVAAEMDNQRGHGLRRLAAYAAQVRSGKVDGVAVPAVRKVRPAFIEVDAAFGFAAPAMEVAIAKLAEIASAQGIAAATVRRSHHCGQLGRWVEMLADLGFVALAFSNSPRAMTAPGGKRAVLGTNPIAFSVPRISGDSFSLTIDLSLSKIARGKVMAAKQIGEKIPSDVALDSAGFPTTDAEAALSGAMLPMGGDKGASLALAVEILCAPLAGANSSFLASSFFDSKGSPPDIGHFIVAILPPRDDFNTRLESLLLEITNEEGVRLPGMRKLESRLRAKKIGVELPGELWQSIQSMTAGKTKM